MADDLNYSLHYQRWHRTDEAYLRDWHESGGASLVRLVGKHKPGGILHIGCGFGLRRLLSAIVGLHEVDCRSHAFPAASGAAAVGHVRVKSCP